jgi:hypothetical protein
MRAEDHVNAHRTAFKQHGRSNGANIILPEILLPPAGSWWERFKGAFKWENLTVAGRDVKGIVVTPAMGLTIVLALGGLLGAGYRSLQGDIAEQRREARESRDLMIEVRTQLKMKDSYDQQEFQKLNNRIDGTQEHQAAFETMIGQKLIALKPKS